MILRVKNDPEVAQIIMASPEPNEPKAAAILENDCT